jgi:hypothetical protein
MTVLFIRVRRIDGRRTRKSLFCFVLGIGDTIGELGCS